MAPLNPLLPDLSAWNHGDGIDATNWLYAIATSDVAVAYSELFWPTFVEFEGYIFREGFTIEAVRSWEHAENSSRLLVESYVNTFDVGELFTLNNEEWSPLVKLRAIHIGRVLAEVHEVKLKRDFPDRTFKVSFFDGSQEEDGEVSLSFWQL